MQTLSEGKWDIERWTELLDSAKCFAEESGIQADSSRVELLSVVDDAIQKCGIAEESVALLCMLGESVAIVPSDAASEAGWSGSLVSELEKSGLQAIISRVGETS
jgi:hypothetical protein